MSTILKTLRKLEEEKNILNQKLDLKGMLLKEDTAYPKPIKSARRKIFLIIIITVLLVVGGTTFHQWEPKPETPTLLKQVPNKTPISQTLPSKDLSRLRTFEGVPMEAILPNELASKPRPDKNISVKRKIKLLPEETPTIPASSEMGGMQNLIRSTTTLAKSRALLPTTIQNGRIPDIRIKGVIFFDKGSLSNHIIATTKNNSNLKLRVGETVQGAVLKSIYPNYVIFLYRDQLIQVSIGQ